MKSKLPYSSAARINDKALKLKGFTLGLVAKKGKTAAKEKANNYESRLLINTRTYGA